MKNFQYIPVPDGCIPVLNQLVKPGSLVPDRLFLPYSRLVGQPYLYRINEVPAQYQRLLHSYPQHRPARISGYFKQVSTYRNAVKRPFGLFFTRESR
jgi:hypothetical protein